MELRANKLIGHRILIRRLGLWMLAGVTAACLVGLPVYLAQRARKRTPVVKLAHQARGGQDYAVLSFSSGVKMEFAKVNPGTFTMGSPAGEEGRSSNETQHQVTLTKAFYVGVTEVTQEQYQAVMGRNPSGFKGPKNPVDNASWNDAMEFCRKLSARSGRTIRLPTEAQWEYACRAGTTTPFNTGATISTDEANYNGTYPYGGGRKGEFREETLPVASFRSNAWGLCDMHGNLWEWCADWSGDYPAGAVTDPTGPVEGTSRVLRGGSWGNYPDECRAAYRYASTPDDRSPYVGFRVCLDLD